MNPEKLSKSWDQASQMNNLNHIEIAIPAVLFFSVRMEKQTNPLFKKG